MSDLIDRQAAIDAFDGHFAIVGRSSAERFKMYIEAVINDIRKLPPAQPQRTGKWLMNDHIGTFKIFTCDKCGWNSEAPFNFCPNCGDKKEIDVE